MANAHKDRCPNQRQVSLANKSKKNDWKQKELHKIGQIKHVNNSQKLEAQGRWGKHKAQKAPHQDQLQK